MIGVHESQHIARGAATRADTAFFVESVKWLLRDYDPELPYVLTGTCRGAHTHRHAHAARFVPAATAMGVSVPERSALARPRTADVMWCVAGHLGGRGLPPAGGPSRAHAAAKAARSHIARRTDRACCHGANVVAPRGALSGTPPASGPSCAPLAHTRTFT